MSGAFEICAEGVPRRNAPERGDRLPEGLELIAAYSGGHGNDARRDDAFQMGQRPDCLGEDGGRHAGDGKECHSGGCVFFYSGRHDNMLGRMGADGNERCFLKSRLTRSWNS